MNVFLRDHPVRLNLEKEQQRHFFGRVFVAVN